MSQLFDALRRGRSSPSLPKTPRTAHGDAVLATLGYSPVRRGGRSSALARAVVVIGVIAGAWAGWRFYLWPRAGTVQPVGVSPAPRTATRATPPPPRTSSAAQPAAPSLVVPAPAPIDPAPPRSPAVERGPAAPPIAAPAPAEPFVRTAPRPPAPLPVTRSEPEALAAGPRSATAPGDDLSLALYYHRAGDFENALQHYRAVLQKNELNAQAHNNLGLLYQEKRLFDESARELQRAILIEPRSVYAHNNYGVTLLLQGKPDEAAASFKLVLKLDPANVDAKVNLALAQRDGGHSDVAMETLLGALSIAPRSPAVHYNLAQLYDRANERARAVEHYRKFLEEAGTEYASRAPAVRSRIDALSRIPD